MANMWQLRKETDICSQCIETNAYKIDDPCSYYQDILEQQEDTVTDLQNHKGKGHRFALKQKQHIAMQKLKIKKLQKLRELDMKNAEETIEQIQAEANEVLAEIRSEAVNLSPSTGIPTYYLIGGGALILLLIVAIVFLYLKLSRINQNPKLQLDGKLDEMVDGKFTEWVKDHVIKEEADYLNNEFTLRITKEKKIHANSKHPRRGTSGPDL